MSILGSVGSLYMVVLILLLIVGLGLIIKGFFEYIFSKNILNSNFVNKITMNGGAMMQTNGWLRLAVFSFVGILISLAVLALISPNNGMNMNTANTHQSHLGAQSGMTGNMNGGAMVSTPMGNMGMQGNMNGMGMMSMQQPMNNMQMDNNMMMNKMNHMQQQMNMMQQQMNMMQMNNMNNMGNMQMPQQGMGGMGMMPMNNMGGMGMMNMPMNNMSGMSGSSGSMSGMSGGSGGGMMMM